MRVPLRRGTVCGVYARLVDERGARLRELRHEQWAEAALAVICFGLAVAASQTYRTLVVPLLVGALVETGLAMRASWRHWELLDRLLGDRDAYTIAEVRARAARAAEAENRARLAASARRLVAEPGLALRDRVAAVSGELDALAAALEDGELTLEPACAVACERLLHEGMESPLLDPARPVEDARARLLQILAGFERR